MPALYWICLIRKVEVLVSLNFMVEPLIRFRWILVARIVLGCQLHKFLLFVFIYFYLLFCFVLLITSQRNAMLPESIEAVSVVLVRRILKQLDFMIVFIKLNTSYIYLLLVLK